MQLRAAAGEIATGLLYVDSAARDWHAEQRTAATALNALGEEALCPGAAALERINAGLR
jgi:2-oxoglutarate/2-oxoacid ferredoxin oxidoreductase subunit beta